MAKNKKTNVIRILDKEKIEYKTYEYDSSDEINDGISVADKIGKDHKLVYKTLVVQGISKSYYVFVIPVEKELDLKKAAKLSKEKKIELIPVKSLLPLTGYIKGGCSPIGMKKSFKTYLDLSVNSVEKMIFSGGKIGIQVELTPEKLINITKASVEDIVK